jgi:8-oxo-dGTP diphosphatase
MQGLCHLHMVLFSNGRKSSFYQMGTIRMLTVIVEVVAAVIRREGRILITQRLDDVHLARLWEFPGGKVEAGESLEAALQREILEELGVGIAVSDEFYTVEHDYPGKSVRLHFFNCTIENGEPATVGVADLRWVLPKDLAQFEFPPADAGLIEKLKQN